MSSDATAVWEAFDGFNDALDRGDYVSAAGWCLPDLLFVGSGQGEYCVGASNLAKMFASLIEVHGAVFVSWALVWDAPPLIDIDGDVARVSATGQATLTLISGVRNSPYVLTGVLRRTPEGWRWWTFHGSEAQPW